MQTRCYNPYNEHEEVLSRTSEIKIPQLMRGVVVDNRDPLCIGRVKVRIESIYKGLRDSELPWCMPCFFAASYNSGTFIIPEVNNIVWVVFEDNDITKPVWIGALYSTNTTRPNQVGNTDEEKRAKTVGESDTMKEAIDLNHKVIYKSPTGSIIYTNETEDREDIVIKNGEGSSVAVGKGLVNLKTANGLEVVLDDNNKEIFIYSKNTRFNMKDDSFTIVNSMAKVEASDKVVIKCGGSSIVLQNGSVVLNASTVQVNASQFIAPIERCDCSHE